MHTFVVDRLNGHADRSSIVESPTRKEEQCGRSEVYHRVLLIIGVREILTDDQPSITVEREKESEEKKLTKKIETRIEELVKRREIFVSFLV